MPSAGAATLAVARRDLGVQVTFRSMTRELVTADLSDAWSERFESLPPVRVPRAFKGQRNFAGSWWFATTQTHVAFESWLERDHLMLLDFAPDVTAVAAQPVRRVRPIPPLDQQAGHRLRQRRYPVGEPASDRIYFESCRTFVSRRST
jgi:hypothetical protein